MGVAACDDDPGLGILTLNAPDGRACILIGRSGDRASVQHDNRSLPGSGGARDTKFLELAFESGAVGLGSTATEILYVVSRHISMVAHPPRPRQAQGWSNVASSNPGFVEPAPRAYQPCHRTGSAAARSGRGGGPPRLKTFSAKHGAALRGTERHGGLFAAPRTGGLGLHLGVAVSLSGRRRSTEHGNPFGLARLAALGFVLELLVVEEKLLPGGENKIPPTINTLQHLVLKLH